MAQEFPIAMEHANASVSRLSTIYKFTLGLEGQAFTMLNHLLWMEPVHMKLTALILLPPLTVYGRKSMEKIAKS